MVRLAHERVLLIGDAYRQVHGALAQALPSAHVTSVPSFFDGVAELVANNFTAVIAAAEPIERRPEAAVRTLRELTGDGRVVLFGHPTLELLNRKMLEFGADDYLITPASVGEIEQIFRAPPARRAPVEMPPDGSCAPAAPVAAPSAPTDLLAAVSLADVMLDATVHAPQDAVAAAAKRVAALLPQDVRLTYRTAAAAEPPEAETGWTLQSQPVYAGQQQAGVLDLLARGDVDAAVAGAALSRLAGLFAKLAFVQNRHNALQKAAITDDLTGLYNARYFRLILNKILDTARKVHFPVTLLLFDIDDFKKYNDQYGHGVGDEILRQTAALMRRCTREHDYVCRIGGDEFAVVFWDKEGPRKPKDAKSAGPHRPPQTPEQIFHRFKQLIEDEKFPVLGTSGKGVLGISAGMAVYPYEAQDAAGLIQEADNRLMHGAKKRGKNSLVIVGTEQSPAVPSD
jgi:GGDEF domain-containing protein